MERRKALDVFLGGLVFDNPVFTVALGCCTAVAATVTLSGALLTGLFVTVTMIFACAICSALKRIIPDEVRIPCHMLILGGLITLARLLVTAYFPVFEWRIDGYFLTSVTCCLVLGRVEAFAIHRSVRYSILDALGCGLGYSAVLVLTSVLRNLLGNGMFFGKYILPAGLRPMFIFAMAPGVLFILGVIAAFINRNVKRKDGEEK